MLQGAVAFPGNAAELEQLQTIWKVRKRVRDSSAKETGHSDELNSHVTLQVLGVPSEVSWPGVSQLPNYKPGQFPTPTSCPNSQNETGSDTLLKIDIHTSSNLLIQSFYFRDKIECSDRNTKGPIKPSLFLSTEWFVPSEPKQLRTVWKRLEKGNRRFM